MQIETTRFGTITVDAEETIRMPFGMPGFADQKKFILLEHRQDSPFEWFQSLKDPSLAFVVTDPRLFKPDYAVDIQPILKNLGWDGQVEDHQLKLFVIVNIPPGAPEKTTANFAGPVLLNLVNREAVQVVIPDGTYSHKFPLAPAAGAA